jgi:hypothetical protein
VSGRRRLPPSEAYAAETGTRLRTAAWRDTRGDYQCRISWDDGLPRCAAPPHPESRTGEARAFAFHEDASGAVVVGEQHADGEPHLTRATYEHHRASFVCVPPAERNPLHVWSALRAYLAVTPWALPEWLRAEMLHVCTEIAGARRQLAEMPAKQRDPGALILKALGLKSKRGPGNKFATLTRSGMSGKAALCASYAALYMRQGDKETEAIRDVAKLQGVSVSFARKAFLQWKKAATPEELAQLRRNSKTERR